MTDAVTLDQVRLFLQFSDTFTDHDDMLSTMFIPAANDAIVAECGDILPETFDEYYDGGDYSIWLRHTPVLSVQLVEEGWGFTNYDLTEIEVNSASMPTMFAFSVDLPNQGKISRRSGGNVNVPFINGAENVHVIYQTGLATIPGGVVLAALTLIGIWYRGFIQDQAESDPYATTEGEYAFGRSDATTTTFNFGVPTMVVEMLKRYRRDPVIG